MSKVLVVANKTAATPALIEAVRERAARGPAPFTLLVPTPPTACTARRPRGPGDTEAADDARARPPAARGGGRQRRSRAWSATAEPLAAIQDAINIHGFDELIISTLPTARVASGSSSTCRHKAAGLGLPVTTVTASGPGGTRAAPEPSAGGRDPLWIWTQVVIVVFVARRRDHRAHQALTAADSPAAMIAPCSARSSWARTGRRRPGRPCSEAIDLAKALGARVEPRLGLRAGPQAAAARGGAADARRPAVDGQPARGRRRDAARRRGRWCARRASSVETFAREGDPADAILDVAEERDADLIVVGNKGMTGARALPARLGAEQGLAPRALLGADHPDDLAAAPAPLTCTGIGAGPSRAAALIRPAAVVRVRPGRAEVGRRRLQPALDRRRASGSAPSTPEAITSAAVADTCGAAIEVPM